ncbi:putative ankyrin repeat protein RF_0381 [Nasonia vitripennis]|uniref:Uncharacterized protein n=1 Tax=Nasonia vitripennis TaxID=7425 RepID=A0A7M7LQF2_NASVI|nr:putative ankyrin repeat protein RF_0381 [Nasonia vitripennis]
MNRTNKTSIKNKVNKSGGSAGDIALKRSSNMLIKAIRQADDVKVRQLLESGVNPNARDNLYQGNDALHYAVNGRSLSILKMLLEHNCYHSDVNYDKESAFEIALKLSKFEFAEALLCFGARVEINLFKDYYAPVDSERRKLALLFFWFADLDARDSNGLAILHLGFVREDIEGISILIRRGAKINQRTRGLGITPLHIAAKTLSVPCVTMLLRLGADLELRDEYGHAPLHHAVVHYQAADSKKRLEVVELLLKAG